MLDADADALLIEPWLAIDREAYLSVAVDGRAEGYVVMYSPKDIGSNFGGSSALLQVGKQSIFTSGRELVKYTTELRCTPL